MGEALEGDWSKAQQQVIERLGVKSTDELFYGIDGEPPAMELLFQIAQAVNAPQPLAKIERLKVVADAKGRFGEEAVERALLFLVPVAQSVFAPIGAAPPTRGPFGGVYVTLPDYLREGATFIDATQGAAADCYLIAAMSALAWVYPDSWTRNIAACGSKSGTAGKFRFAFFRRTADRYPEISVDPGVAAAIPQQDDAALKVGVDVGPRLYYARSSDRDESWPGIIEKAYLMQFGNVKGTNPSPKDYLALDNLSYPEVACQRLAGGSRHAIPCGGPDEAAPKASHVLNRLCDARRRVTSVPTMATTWATRNAPMGSLHWSDLGLIHAHAYTVLGMTERGGIHYVVLRNPHGFSAMRTGDHNHPDIKYLEGTWRPGKGATGAAEVVLNTAGVFALPADCFDKAFGTVAYVTPPPQSRKRVSH